MVEYKPILNFSVYLERRDYGLSKSIYMYVTCHKLLVFFLILKKFLAKTFLHYPNVYYIVQKVHTVMIKTHTCL